MATIIPEIGASPAQDGAYHDDLLLVTLKPDSSIVREAAAAFQISALGDNDFLERGIATSPELEHSNFSVSAESEDDTILQRLERAGLILDVSPLRRPRSGESEVSSQIPIGAGRIAMAAFEALADRVKGLPIPF